MPKQILWGAIAGDVIGSTYEYELKKDYNFELFPDGSYATDDSVMTIAVADWLVTGRDLASVMRRWGAVYPTAGYGGMFKRWLRIDGYPAYNSFGNGSAMRVSAVGWAFDNLQQTLDVAEMSAEVSHNHPEGIKGAQAVAAAIFLARAGHSKADIKRYVHAAFGYDLNRKYAEILPDYTYDVTCQGCVPESIICFLESENFEDAVRKAVAMGGDADTMGAITGSIAEAFYGGVPADILNRLKALVPADLAAVVTKFNDKFNNHIS